MAKKRKKTEAELTQILGCPSFAESHSALRRGPIAASSTETGNYRSGPRGRYALRDHALTNLSCLREQISRPAGFLAKLFERTYERSNDPSTRELKHFVQSALARE